MAVVAASTVAPPAFADDWPLYLGCKIHFSVKGDRDAKPLLSDVGVVSNNPKLYSNNGSWRGGLR